ncbi:Acyl-coenzyme A dehydrogenase FadE [hydrothermal vent metagenome]|uniref:Acyl-coenzyme A dehydrogenase n=1 Tax=hydrothermal vent metagenome TaxID=652676 RepID=A0A3B0V1F2_9ZZZZ
MNFLILFGMFLGATFICSYLKTNLKTWTGVTAVVMALATWKLTLGWFAVGLVWILFVAAALILNNKQLRKQIITAPFLGFYKKALPKLSETERIALESGTVSWDGELFSGKPNFKKLHDIPAPQLSSDEQAFIDGPVSELCGMVYEYGINHEKGDLPAKVWQFIRDNGFIGMIIAKKYGGLGFSALGHSMVLQKLASRSVVVAATVAVPNSLGPAELLHQYGTQAQKDYYLPRLAAGTDIPCFALTGPTAGSDATSIPDTGVVCKRTYKGKKQLGVLLNFDKRYITLAPVATVVGLAFQMLDPDGLIGDKKQLDITLALIPRDIKGMDIGRRHNPLDVMFMNGPVRGKDVFIPMSYLIGGEKMIGKGWMMLVECLSVGRAISLPSCSTGGAKMVAFATGAYARIRKQFNIPIGRFEGIEEALCEIAGLTYTCAATATMTALAVDQGEVPAVPSAIAKMHATDMSRKIISHAMDVHGGKGIVMGPRNYLGRAWMGLPIWITVEGANILTRSMIIFGQGAIRCHPYVLKEMEAANIADKQERLDKFDDVLFQHIGYSFSNAVRSFFMGLGLWRLEKAPADKFTKKFYAKITRYSAAFGLAADVSMLTLGGALKKKEKTSARLGDVLSHLYMASAVLKRYRDQGSNYADQSLVAWALHQHFYKIEQALKLLTYNFPNKVVGFVLRRLVLPLGNHELPAGDRLGHKAASLILNPNETRARLTDGIDKDISEHNIVAKMNETLIKVIDAEPLERRVLKAVKAGEIDAIAPAQQLQQALDNSIINKKEFDKLTMVRAETMEVIAVDDFDLDAFDRTTKKSAKATKIKAA